MYQWCKSLCAWTMAPTSSVYNENSDGSRIPCGTSTSRRGWLINNVDWLCATGQIRDDPLHRCFVNLKRIHQPPLHYVVVDSIEGGWEVKECEKGKTAFIHGVYNVRKDFEQHWLTRTTTSESWLKLWKKIISKLQAIWRWTMRLSTFDKNGKFEIDR